jgi:hypothetical protein
MGLINKGMGWAKKFLRGKGAQVGVEADKLAGQFGDVIPAHVPHPGRTAAGNAGQLGDQLFAADAPRAKVGAMGGGPGGRVGGPGGPSVEAVNAGAGGGGFFSGSGPFGAFDKIRGHISPGMKDAAAGFGPGFMKHVEGGHFGRMVKTGAIAGGVSSAAGAAINMANGRGFDGDDAWGMAKATVGGALLGGAAGMAGGIRKGIHMGTYNAQIKNPLLQKNAMMNKILKMTDFNVADPQTRGWMEGKAMRGAVAIGAGLGGFGSLTKPVNGQRNGRR